MADFSLPFPGNRIRLHPFLTPAEVFRCEERDGQIVLGLIFLDTKRAETFVLSPAEFAARVVRLSTLQEDFAAGKALAREPFLLYAEALRMRLAYTFDPHYAVSVTQVDLLPHQVDAVYDHILPRPRIRFLLADDPGLGKTIMAGLVLKELKARGVVRNTLIVVPAHLLDQWQGEMWDWFREDFTIVDHSLLNNIYSDDFFVRNPQLIVSMDFAKQGQVKEQFARRRWNLVIVDEAHKFSATRYPSGRTYKTIRYQLGEALAPQCDHLLFLTATPHKGDDAAYFLLLDLVQPRLFASPEQMRDATGLNGLPFVLRRSKEQVTDLNGNKLFKKREVARLPVSLTEAERELYEAVTAYVRRWYVHVADARDKRSRNVALALTVLQRRLASSLTAIRESLRRRRAKLQTRLEHMERVEEEALWDVDEESLAEFDDATDAERARREEKLEGLSAAETPEEQQREIEEIDGLIALAVRAEKAGEQAKLNELKSVVEKRLRGRPDEKLLVFTEFKDTLKALQAKFEREWGFAVAAIHGDMNRQERIEQQRRFRDEDNVQVMVATDAAGEGINLQFCRLMVNFDLPWNPNRLEQRMGRIHRYGQKRDCYIFNLLYHETREGKVLDTLLAKLEQMRARLGDSVYDVVGTLLQGVRLEELVMQAILRGDISEVEAIIERSAEETFERYRRAIEENALAGHHIDLATVSQNDAHSKQMRLVPWDVERFTRFALRVVGGSVKADERKGDGIFRVAAPREFTRQHHLGQESFVRGLRVAFERERARQADAEFFAPGHPLLEALLDHFLADREKPVRAVLADPGGRAGSLWLFHARVQDGQGHSALERLLALFCDQRTGDTFASLSTSLQQVDPRMLWDLDAVEPGWAVPASYLDDLAQTEAQVRAEVAARMNVLFDEAHQRRAREVGIKREWLSNSFGTLIQESDARLREYQRRADEGRDERLNIQNEEANLKALIQEREARLAALEREEQLVRLEPELEAVALIVPKSALTPAMAAPSEAEEIKRRVEMAGMEAAMAYERAHGRNPYDVSQEYRGYDIYTEGAGEVRHIEVKAFATTGELELSLHEWQMAQRLGDAYWLYVVENALSESLPEPMTIRNPAAILRPQEVWGVVKVVISEWKQ